MKNTCFEKLGKLLVCNKGLTYRQLLRKIKLADECGKRTHGLEKGTTYNKIANRAEAELRRRDREMEMAEFMRAATEGGPWDFTGPETLIKLAKKNAKKKVGTL